MRVVEDNPSTRTSVATKDRSICLQAVRASSWRALKLKRPSPGALTNIAQGAVTVSILLGLTGLTAWWLDVGALQTILPGRPRMVPNTGLSLVALGLALWLVLPEPIRWSWQLRFRTGQGLALLVAASGLATFAQHMLGSGIIEQRLFYGGRPPYPAALCALAVGLGIALLDVRLRGVWLTELLAVITMQMALLAGIGHIFGVPELYGSLSFRPDSGMAVPSVAAFLMLGAGLLCARADRGLMKLLRSHTPGGTLARRWMLTPVAVLLVMGLVYLLMQRTTGVQAGMGTWTLLMTSLTYLTIAIWATARVLHRAGLERDHAHRTLERRVLQRTAELEEANQALNAAKEGLARANEDLEKTVAERTLHLNETIRALETVCYNIAHDLRAPNRAIAGFAEALLAKHAASLDELTRECLERMAAAARRSDVLTLDLLAYGRLGHTDLPCSTQSLEGHLHAVKQKLAQQIEAAQASIEVAGPLPEVWAHPTALEQVLTNLLSNAIKFVCHGTRPHVRIWAQRVGDSWRVLIQDNGIGIAVEHQQRIFDVFQRLHSPEEYPGTGIGLAIVQKSLQRMAGKIGLNSSVGNGSCFWFELPIPPRT